MNNQLITINATIAVSREKLWNYYVDPEHITKWNSASDDWHCPSASNDLRVGGKYMARMEAKDGSFGFDFEAVYNEVIENEKIAYTMGDGRKAEVNFNAMDANRTELTVSFEPEQENPIEMQRDGWASILNNFKKYAETSE